MCTTAMADGRGLELGRGRAGDGDLPAEVWHVILRKLPVPAMARAACVCRLWQQIVADPEVMAGAFRAAWKVKEVRGLPASGSFWRGQRLSQFAISHELQRQDTVRSLAVRYQVQVPDILRLNNMMTEYAIHSRKRLLVPVLRAELLEGQTCFIEVDMFAKREVAVLYLEGSRAAHHTKVSLLHSDFCRSSQDRVARGILHSLKRSLRVDDEVAQAYLLLTDGDVRAAYQRFSEDMRWEMQGAPSK